MPRAVQTKSSLEAYVKVQPGQEVPIHKTRSIQRSSTLYVCVEPVLERVTKKIWKVISDMKQDEVTQVVKSDTCIIIFGEHLCNKMGSNKTKHKYIRTNMREAGRLSVCARKEGKMQSIKDFFIPTNFCHVIKAVKDTSGFRDDDVFTVPSLALKLGHNLNKWPILQNVKQ